jgi:signal transduction histidine kinase
METENITISHEEVEIALENRLEKNYLLVATIGVSIQFFWTILDLIVIPDLWIQLLFFRLGILLLPILLGLTYKKLGLKAVHCIFLASVLISLISMYITFSIPKDKFNTYVLGDIVFFIGVGMLATWKIWYSIALLVLTVVFASIVFYFNSPLDFTTSLSLGGFSIGSVACLSVLMIFSRYNDKYTQTKMSIRLKKSNEIIKQKSLENNSLQVQLHENEKYSLISEITASISHELNTPLSVVLNGSKAIKDITLEIINLVQKIDSSQWPLIKSVLNNIRNRPRELSSIRQFEEAKNIEKIFSTINSKEIDSTLSRNMVNIGFKQDDTTFFESISSFENYKEILLLIVKLKFIEDFNESIENSILKSSTIIHDLKSFVNTKSEEIISLDIRTTLENALYLYFQSQSTSLNELIVMRNPIQIKGNEIKLTQIWLKLIDYISICINQNNKNIKLMIFVKEINDKVAINFRFKKPINDAVYLLTKQSTSTDRSEKELNLSILKNLILENNLSLILINLTDEFEIQVQVPIN